VKILFDKVAYNPQRFSIEKKGISMSGTLEKSSQHTILLKAFLTGDLELACDRCGSQYLQKINEHIELTISDIIAQSKEDLDIIEFLDGAIDMEYILDSESNTISGDYHYCTRCIESDEILEIEI